jgi:hypothetical protein
MTQPQAPAPGAKTIAPSSPASRPRRCAAGLRPALTPAAGGTTPHLSGAGQKEDQQFKIHLIEASTVSGDCRRSGGRGDWLPLESWRVQLCRCRMVGGDPLERGR